MYGKKFSVIPLVVTLTDYLLIGNEIMIRRTNSYSARLPIDDSASPGACSDMSESETPSFQSIDFDSLDNFATTLESSRNYVCAQTTHVSTLLLLFIMNL